MPCKASYASPEAVSTELTEGKRVVIPPGVSGTSDHGRPADLWPRRHCLNGIMILSCKWFPELTEQDVRSLIDTGVYETAGFAFQCLLVRGGGAPTVEQARESVRFVDQQTAVPGRTLNTTLHRSDVPVFRSVPGFRLALTASPCSLPGRR